MRIVTAGERVALRAVGATGMGDVGLLDAGAVVEVVIASGDDCCTD